ncbi:hypothetical protein HS7_21170 [Sulfolobales archaeon HS-7]|nr:hypothetical protein HS7_21170 [Sulfolobales archaeon HS-7]
MFYMSTLKRILEAFVNREVLNPGEAVVITSLPRYEVLAYFHIMEELDLIECIYSRGSHKVYQLTDKGKEVLDGMKEGKIIDVVVRESDMQFPESVRTGDKVTV